MIEHKNELRPGQKVTRITIEYEDKGTFVIPVKKASYYCAVDDELGGKWYRIVFVPEETNAQRSG